MVRPPSKPVTPFTFQVLKLVIAGHIGSTQTWSTGVYIIHSQTDEPPSPVDLGFALSAYESPVAAWANAFAPIWAQDTQYDKMDLYAYSPDSGRAHSQSQLTPTAIVGMSGQNHPGQVSLVQSLRTNLAGASHRGRMYAPATGVSLQANLQLTQTQCNDLAGATGSLLTAINQTNLAGHGLTATACVIASRTTQTYTAIDEVVTDSRPDIQRRRADKLLPAFVGQAAVSG